MLSNFFSNFKFAPTYAELEKKLELYAGLLLDQDDLLDEAHAEMLDLEKDNEDLSDLVDDLIGSYDELEAEVSKLKKELVEAQTKLSFIKCAILN
jgi:peptidoglycan hydrolase CwlO-like protein